MPYALAPEATTRNARAMNTHLDILARSVGDDVEMLRNPAATAVVQPEQTGTPGNGCHRIHAARFGDRELQQIELLENPVSGAGIHHPPSVAAAPHPSDRALDGG